MSMSYPSRSSSYFNGPYIFQQKNRKTHVGVTFGFFKSFGKVIEVLNFELLQHWALLLVNFISEMFRCFLYYLFNKMQACRVSKTGFSSLIF